MRIPKTCQLAVTIVDIVCSAGTEMRKQKDRRMKKKRTDPGAHEVVLHRCPYCKKLKIWNANYQEACDWCGDRAAVRN